jgi:peptide methionine sulfoxide reductase MsrA
MRQLKNVHSITVKYIGPSNTKGSRVSITSDRFKERVLISYDYQLNSIYEMAQAYLESKGFYISGVSETKGGYILLTNHFMSIK